MKGALKDMDEEKARAYCSCMLQKVQKKYPNAADAKYLKNDTAIYSMGRECMK
jgi:trans-aconitate methyltransferase